MKNYHNPQHPEGINTSKAQPLKTFLKLFTAIVIILFAVAWLLGQSGSWLASLIPYQQEVKMSEQYLHAKATTELDETYDQTDYFQIQQYLEKLVQQIEPNMDLPKGMHIHVHYEPEDVENAFATLGGHIFMYKGMLEKLPNENSLAMLLAHEMSHVKLRHPIRAAGQSMAISTGIKYLLGYSNMGLLGNAGLYTQLTFSRSMESAADTEGLKAVYHTYDTVAGATDLFETLHEVQIESGVESSTPFFSTHPLDDKRINDLNQYARKNGWVDQQEPTLLPDDFNNWL
jgi:predicted Zn-dependent protease